MHKLRFAILGAAAALALGTAGAVAMQDTASSSDPDSHGDAVSAAAHSCAHGANGVHGDCVSDVASSKSEAGEKDEDGNQARAAACKAADATEDKTEKAPAKGDTAAKKADKAEDKTEHKAFAACVSGKTSTTTK